MLTLEWLDENLVVLTVCDNLNLLLRQLHLRIRLAQNRQNRSALVPSHNWNLELPRIGVGKYRGHKSSADYVERGDAEEAGRVVDTVAAKDSGSDGDGAVHGVGDYADEGLGEESLHAGGE